MSKTEATDLKLILVGPQYVIRASGVWMGEYREIYWCEVLPQMFAWGHREHAMRFDSDDITDIHVLYHLEVAESKLHNAALTVEMVVLL